MDKIEYKELGYASIKENRNLVLSECSKGGYTLAQQIIVDEGNRKTGLFLKNAIHIDDISGLYNLRDVLNIAISKIEKK